MPPQNIRVPTSTAEQHEAGAHVGWQSRRGEEVNPCATGPRSCLLDSLLGSMQRHSSCPASPRQLACNSASRAASQAC